MKDLKEKSNMKGSKKENDLIFENYVEANMPGPASPPIPGLPEPGEGIDDYEGWIENAERTGINPKIIAFVKSDPDENFYKEPANPDIEMGPSPRQFALLSQKMSEIQKRYAMAKRAGEKLPKSFMQSIFNAAATRCGREWATRFVEFLGGTVNSRIHPNAPVYKSL
jgi:hypothetical protein